MYFEDRTCVVTGASRGIGKEIALELGRHGAEVVVDYHASKEKAQQVVDEIEENGGTAIPIQADVTDLDAVRDMAEKTHDKFGGVDVLVNNAGINVDRKFEDMEREHWDRVVDVNLNGTFNCTSTFYGDIKEAEHGRLINISSVVGEQGNFGQANYAGTKSALHGFTYTLALELSSSGSTANCVAPGFILTEMLEGVPQKVKDNLLDDIPLGRFGQPEEVANLVRFLAHKNSSYITGQVISINGGMERG